MATKKNKTKRKANLNSLFSLDEIKDFIRFVEKSDITEVQVTLKDKSLFVSKNNKTVPGGTAYAGLPGQAARPEPAEPVAQLPADKQAPEKKSSHLLEITAPIVGTFYRSPSPGAPVFVNEGDTVSPGKVVCIIEAMKIFNEIKSEVKGVIKEICIQNEQPVEFGQTLFLIEPK
jgi:acetyl-CoA carboxylase biotin carboxyl carrier protein